jgi:putative N-acetylmannosamine-6-phosphate epimerase
MNLPPKGLIVSCYLESMRGCEKAFIASLVNNKHVAGLRVEGLDNIQYARMLTDKFIIGLVKKMKCGVMQITPTYEDYRDVLSAGADIVASGCGLTWKEIPNSLMVDMDKDSFNELIHDHRFDEGIKKNTIILATTYENKGYGLLVEVNFEGGVMCQDDIDRAFMLGADWVTIGKAINDPPTIVNNLVNHIKEFG